MLVARVVVVLAWILGAGSLVLFGAFLWADNFSVINLRLAPHSLLVWDASLCVLFFAQHSILIRRSVRAALKETIPEYCQGVAYTFTSALALLTLVLLWQHSAMNLYALHGMGRWLLRLVLLLAFTGFFWGVRSLESFDAFGIEVYLAQSAGRIPSPRRSPSRVLTGWCATRSTLSPSWHFGLRRSYQSIACSLIFYSPDGYCLEPDSKNATCWLNLAKITPTTARQYRCLCHDHGGSR